MLPALIPRPSREQRMKLHPIRASWSNGQLTALHQQSPRSDYHECRFNNLPVRFPQSPLDLESHQSRSVGSKVARQREPYTRPKHYNTTVLMENRLGVVKVSALPISSAAFVVLEHILSAHLPSHSIFLNPGTQTKRHIYATDRLSNSIKPTQVPPERPFTQENVLHDCDRHSLRRPRRHCHCLTSPDSSPNKPSPHARRIHPPREGQ